MSVRTGAASDPERDEGGLSPDQLKRGFTLLAITTFFAYIVINIPQTISPNFFRDEIGMDGALNGYLIAIREVPGFLLIFVAAVLLRHGLALATAIALAVAGVGYFLFAGANSFVGLIIPTLIASVGYHSWLQLQDALGLSLAKQGEEGSVLGRFRSIGFAGTIVALLVTLAILFCVERTSGDLRAAQGPWLRGLYVATAICAFVGALVIFRFPVSASARAAARVAPRITWRKEYSLYYWLSFLDGSRMQIYFAFAPFVLVEQFGVDALTLTLLLVVSAVINWQTGGLVGKLVDRYGEKRMLTVGYSMHLLVFLGFALLAEHLAALPHLSRLQLPLPLLDRHDDLSAQDLPARGPGAEPGHGRLAGAPDRHRGADRRRRALAAAWLSVPLPLRHHLHLHLALADAEDRYPEAADRRRPAAARAATRGRGGNRRGCSSSFPSIADRWSARWRRLGWPVRIPRDSRAQAASARSFRMSRRAEVLADRCDTAIQAVIDLIAGASPDALHRRCEAEGWTAAAVAAHVALSQDFLIDRVRRIVEGEEFPLFDAAAFHGRNARAAEENAVLSSGQVIALLRNHGAQAVEYVRGLSDDELDRGRPILAMGDDPTTAEQFVDRVLIGHAEAHLQSLRQCLSNPDPVPG